MITQSHLKLISEIVSPSMMLVDEPMSKHTTFRIGGPADVLAEPTNETQLEGLLKMLRQTQLPYIIIGNGSNILVADKGIRGVVVKLGNDFADCLVDGNTMSAQSGIKLSKLAKIALDNGLTGLEFAAGIPGTLGGALFMNAGAYDGEMKNVVDTVTYFDEKGKKNTIKCDDCMFGYRTSIFAQNPDWVIIGCTINLEKGDKDAIRAKMDDFAQRRSSKQPLNLPSAGSTFKRPEGAFAGKLIQDAGLMGYRVGGASVSVKHAGFLVNDQDATAADMRELIRQVQEKVKEMSGFDLHTEVKMIGDF